MTLCHDYCIIIYATKWYYTVAYIKLKQIISYDIELHCLIWDEFKVNYTVMLRVSKLCIYIYIILFTVFVFEHEATNGFCDIYGFLAECCESTDSANRWNKIINAIWGFHDRKKTTIIPVRSRRNHDNSSKIILY